MNKDSTFRIETATGGVTAAQGFTASGVECGVWGEGVLDLGLLYSDRACVPAAVYTRSVLQGAPLAITREAVEGGDVRAVVANSGISNTATGERGIEDAREMQRLAARETGLDIKQVTVASTGVIGERLPMGRIQGSIAQAAGQMGSDGSPFAEAILTTDTRTKQAAVRMETGGRLVTVGGVAKGSGMIHPDMATMLTFLTTDAAVEHEALQATLSRASERTFNRVTVDGDTSPNDMVVLLANGAAENETLKTDSPDHQLFEAAVEEVCRALAKEIACDGEGATRLVEVVVEGASDEQSAAKLARCVASSSLVKTAVYGEDANWGRVITAMGYAGVPFRVEEVDLYFGEVKVFATGEPTEYKEADAAEVLAGEEVRITARLSEGEASAIAYGCDLTHGYVEINGSYRT